MRPPAAVPSPSRDVWHLGAMSLRVSAICIVVAIAVAIVVADRRWRARGGAAGTVVDVATVAVPFGLVGGRIYHLLTDWSPYFGRGGRPLQSVEIWRGGLGIPGAVAVGALGAYLACRHRGVALPPMADAIAPGLVLGQAIGRFGGVVGTFHRTFLYESIWDVGTAGLLLWADRRFRLGHGRVFALYLMVYGAGRGWIEALRTDPAHHLLGLRLDDWTSILLVTAGLIGFVVSARRRPGREVVVEPDAGRDQRQSEAVLDTVSGAGPAGDGGDFGI
jgi:prolipoprotein diacylglyceryltransferase